MDSVRVDKWLWTIRIFKSRTLAGKTCKENKVKVNDVNAKSSTQVKVGDRVTVKKNGFNFTFVVKALLKSRVSAQLAQPCYEDVTPEDELNKYKSWFIGKAAAERREKGEGRPTKRERREIDEYKWQEMHDYFDDDLDEEL